MSDTSKLGERHDAALAPTVSESETYYTKGKDAEYFEKLSDKDFSWALTCASQDLNDSDENVSTWMPVSALLDGAADRIKKLSAAPAPTVSGEPEGPAAADTAVAWAVERWNAEVKNRPLQNVHRAALDTTWRQVIRYFGGDPDALLPLPDHYAMASKAGVGFEPDPSPTRAEVLEEPDMLEAGRKYEDNRKPDLIIRDEPFYSGAQLRAAYRHGYDFARALAGEKP